MCNPDKFTCCHVFVFRIMLQSRLGFLCHYTNWNESCCFIIRIDLLSMWLDQNVSVLEWIWLIWIEFVLSAHTLSSELSGNLPKSRAMTSVTCFSPTHCVSWAPSLAEKITQKVDEHNLWLALQQPSQQEGMLGHRSRSEQSTVQKRFRWTWAEWACRKKEE